MRMRKRIVRRLVTLVLLAVGVSTAAASDSVGDLAVIVNPATALDRLSATELENIFTSSRKSWPDGSNITAFSYAPEDPLRHAFDGVVLRMSPDEVARFWLDQRVRGGARPPRQVPDETLAVRLVAKLKGSIAYVPAKLVNPSVKVVARIRGDKVIAP